MKRREEDSRYEIGVEFNRAKPPVSDQTVQTAPVRPDAHVSDMDMYRWGYTLRQKSRQILVVEQKQLDALDILNFMHGYGFTGETASTPREAMLSAFSSNPDMSSSTLFSGQTEPGTYQNA